MVLTIDNDNNNNNNNNYDNNNNDDDDDDNEILIKREPLVPANQRRAVQKENENRKVRTVQQQ